MSSLDTGEFDIRAMAAVPVLQRPVPPPVRLDLGARTNPGLVRDNNEDHFIVARLGRTMDVLATNLPEGQVPAHHEEAAYALAVADGMGGAAAGEVASALALTLGIELTLCDGRWPLRLSDEEVRQMKGRVDEYFQEMDRVVTERARTMPGLRGMGTTMTVAYAVGVDLVVFHVGDSRAYLFRDGSLQQITRDETVAQALVDAGHITPEAADSHHLRHVLTRAIGTGECCGEAAMHRTTVRPGNRLLLCSDGLTDMVSNEAIARVLGAGRPAQETCDELISAALAGGGKDNVTVIVAAYEAD